MRFILIAVVLLVVIAFLAKKRKGPTFITNEDGGNELPGSPVFGPYPNAADYT